ncbi:DUF1648 domain-containing protein [Agrococcus jejuensis]|uniref:DUF1648 domain-containing protein n=1 Tax=Agrococcus jejuensis TaxID=399736 RepID=A0A1G8GZM2_9MICO|nr:DUF1648 domain-containing protein [Agrococcus jejuensis]SDH99852.1 Protein of unknown function [Agrococcus jejuensis]
MAARTRPAWQHGSAPGVRALRIATLVAAAVGIVAALVAFPTLPAVIPTHFGITGEADAFGPRWTLLPLLALWAALQLLFAWVSTHPEWGNLPVAITEANAQRVYRETERMLVLLGAALVVVFGGIVLAIVGLPGQLVLGIGVVAVLVVTVVGIVRIVRAA